MIRPVALTIGTNDCNPLSFAGATYETLQWLAAGGRVRLGRGTWHGAGRSDRGRPRVLGVGFESTPGVESVSRLAARAVEVASLLGLRSEEREFHPHVTFARLREPWPRAAVDDYAPDVEAWPFPTWNARSCVLFESRLEPHDP